MSESLIARVRRILFGRGEVRKAAEAEHTRAHRDLVTRTLGLADECRRRVEQETQELEPARNGKHEP